MAFSQVIDEVINDPEYQRRSKEAHARLTPDVVLGIFKTEINRHNVVPGTESPVFLIRFPSTHAILRLLDGKPHAEDAPTLRYGTVEGFLKAVPPGFAMAVGDPKVVYVQVASVIALSQLFPNGPDAPVSHATTMIRL